MAVSVDHLMLLASLVFYGLSVFYCYAYFYNAETIDLKTYTSGVPYFAGAVMFTKPLHDKFNNKKPGNFLNNKYKPVLNNIGFLLGCISAALIHEGYNANAMLASVCGSLSMFFMLIFLRPFPVDLGLFNMLVGLAFRFSYDPILEPSEWIRNFTVGVMVVLVKSFVEVWYTDAASKKDRIQAERERVGDHPLGSLPVLKEITTEEAPNQPLVWYHPLRRVIVEAPVLLETASTDIVDYDQLMNVLQQVDGIIQDMRMRVMEQGKGRRAEGAVMGQGKGRKGKGRRAEGAVMEQGRGRKGKGRRAEGAAMDS